MGENRLARKRGLYFEEFQIGDATDSVGRTITEADIVNFAGISGDYNLIHTDAEYAKSQLFGQRVAHDADPAQVGGQVEPNLEFAGVHASGGHACVGVAQCVVAQALQDAENVVSLRVERGKQRPDLRVDYRL